MGNSLDPQVMRSFGDELEKLGAIPGAGLLRGTWQNIKTLGKRYANPVEGMREGWKHMSPKRLIESGAPEGKAIQDAIAKTQAGGWKSKLWSTGSHLTGPSQGVGQAYRSRGGRGVAEELSRRGWTGQGRLTKYMPIGEKGQQGMFAASAAPSVARVATGRGEGTEGEDIGANLGFVVPGILGAGTGFVGNMLAPIAGSMIAGGIGKNIDERRGAGKKTNYPTGPIAYRAARRAAE